MDLSKKIRSIQNYPIRGVTYRDITTLLKDKDAFAQAIDQMSDKVSKDIDLVLGIEARGFMVGAPIAYKLNKGFIPVRKPGKLPYSKTKEEFSLEYGKDAIEIHNDSIIEGQKVVIIDDLLATGGTSLAAIDLVKKLGGIVTELVFLIELTDLKGKEKLNEYEVHSIIKF